jgi:hypothetical protein
MFVGPGPLAHSSSEPAAVAPPPARVRVALPVLGRVQPAHGEVPAGSAKRTGEALREILPGLFEDEGK